MLCVTYWRVTNTIMWRFATLFGSWLHLVRNTARLLKILMRLA